MRGRELILGRDCRVSAGEGFYVDVNVAADAGFTTSDLDWMRFYIEASRHAASKSKDRSTKVGAVAVDWRSKSQLGMGYNGFPRGVDDNADERHERPTKYLFTEHAERNLFYNAGRLGTRLEGAWLFMPFEPYPCADCARGAIQVGIHTIVGTSIRFPGVGDWNESLERGREMMLEAGVNLVIYPEGSLR